MGCCGWVKKGGCCGWDLPVQYFTVQGYCAKNDQPGVKKHLHPMNESKLYLWKRKKVKKFWPIVFEYVYLVSTTPM